MNNPATIAFKCESCGQAMRAKAEYAGRKTACQNCKTVMEIPRTLQVPIAPRSTSRPVPPGPAAPGPAAYGSQNYPGHTQSNYPSAPSPPYQPQSGYASQNYPGQNSFPGVGGYPNQPTGGILPQPGYAAPAYPPNPDCPPSPGNYAPGSYAPSNYAQNQNSAASNYPNYPSAPASNVGESCPSCGSFFPPSLQTCPKCRFDRSTSKKLPYQNMMQPVAFSQPALPPPTPRSQSAFVESEIQWGVIGTGVLMIFGAIVWFGLGLMGGVIFFYPIIMVFIGLGMIVKGLMGG